MRRTAHSRGPLALSRTARISLRGFALRLRERSRMTDQVLVAIVLIVGGGLYLAIFLWITQARVRDLGPDKKPGEHTHS
jgi:hypothetical protein